MESVEQVFRISFFEQIYEFQLEVENFILFPDETTIAIPAFYPDQKREFSAFLKKTSDNLYLNFTQDVGAKILINHYVSVTDPIGNVPAKNHIFKEKSHLYKKGDKACSFEFDVSKLVDFCLTSKCDTLVFNCSMEMILNKTKEVPLKEKEVPQKKVEMPREMNSLMDVHSKSSENLSILSENLKAMFSESKLADITLNVEDQYVKAHKSILSARSPVFSKLLSDLQSDANELTLTDIKLAILNGLLEFLYTGTLNNDDFEFVFELYHAAYVYEVDSLQTTCVSILLSKLDISNACRVLVHADRHLNDKFKASVIDYIQSNYNEIKGTEAFTLLEKEQPGLAVEVLKVVLG